MEKTAKRANLAYHQNKYAEARDLYTEALRQATKSSDIALILRNRSSCHRELKNNDLAFRDAQEAINNDSACLKGYKKAGELAMQLGLVHEALGYLRDGYLKAVEDNGDLDPLKFLVHMAEVIPTVEDIKVEMILRRVQLSRSHRTMLVEQLVTEQKWHLVHAVFFRGGGGHQPNSGGIATGCDTSNIDMAPILYYYCSQPHVLPYVTETIRVLLEHGSGLGATPMHDLLLAELVKDEDLPVMTLVCTNLRARFMEQIKATDANRNTLLHWVAMSGKRCTVRAAKLLLDAGIDPHVKNAKGKRAVHYAPGGSELFIYLNSRRDEARGAQAQSRQPPNPQRTSKAKPQNTEAPMGVEKRLETFARTISEAKLKDVGDMTEEHRQCLKDIANAIDTLKVKQIPATVLVEAPPSVWQGVVKELSSQKKWRTLGVLLTGGGNKYNTGEGGLASGCDTTCVSLKNVLTFFETRVGKQSGLKKHSVMRELLKGGTSPDGDTSDNHPIGNCLRKKDFVSVQMLLEHGAKFSRLTRKERNALLCAAVQTASEGNTGILNLLLNKKEIDHRVRDSNGNNLLHIAVRETCSVECAVLIKHLLDIGVDSSAKNKKGMTPLDHLKQEDRRRQLLEPQMKKEEETENNNETHRNCKASSKGTGQKDLTSSDDDEIVDSSEEKTSIAETQDPSRGTDHKGHKDLTSSHDDKSVDGSEEKTSIAETQDPSRGTDHKGHKDLTSSHDDKSVDGSEEKTSIAETQEPSRGTDHKGHKDLTSSHDDKSVDGSEEKTSIAETQEPSRGTDHKGHKDLTSSHDDKSVDGSEEKTAIAETQEPSRGTDHKGHKDLTSSHDDKSVDGSEEKTAIAKTQEPSRGTDHKGHKDLTSSHDDKSVDGSEEKTAIAETQEPSRGTDHKGHKDLTSSHDDRIVNSSEEKTSIVETDAPGQGTDYKSHKDLTSSHDDRIVDSSEEKTAIGETEKPVRGEEQKPSSSAQKKTTTEDIEIRIRHSISKIPPPLEEEETEERILRLVRQKSYQTTNPMTNTMPEKEQVKSDEEKEDKKLEAVTEVEKPPPSSSDSKEAEELPNTSTDVFDEDNPWEVEYTKKVIKILTEEKRLPWDVKKRVFEKLNRLAKGEWTKELKKTVRGRAQDERMQLFEAKVDKSTRILWELAIAFSKHSRVDPMKWLKGGHEAGDSNNKASGDAVYVEIIRLWDIVRDHDNLKRAIDQAVTSFKDIIPIPKKGLIRGTDRTVTQESFPRLPTMFFVEKNITTSSREIPVEQEFSVVGSNIPKFYSSSSSLVNTSLGNINLPVDFPFKVNEGEHAIVHLRTNPPSSTLLLGRSGTGKTTCCLFRLWNAFIAYWTESAARGFQPWGYTKHGSANGDEDEEADQEGHETAADQDHKQDSKSKDKGKSNVENRSDQRPGLSDINVDSDIKRTDDEDESLHAQMLNRQGNSTAPAAETTESPETAKEQFEHLHQIFVTKNAVLCSEVGEQFRRYCNAEKVTQVYLKAIQRDDKIPVRLQDVDLAGFPLFLDSRRWLLMLDASLEGTSFFKRTSDGHMAEEVPGWMKTNDNAALVLENNSFEREAEREAVEEAGKRQHERRTMRLVTYEVFCTELWKRVNREREDYHPTLVWMDIVSIIKGSFEAVETADGFLSREEYLEIGKKRAEFTGDRDKIYDIFLAYHHEKRQRHMFDEMDLVHNLYKRLIDAEDVDWSIHQVYVDETQDFTQAELALLIRCCRDPNEMFFTGDTAQSIMRGVSFRFKDLHSLFHKARESLQQMGKKTAVRKPSMRYLYINYRSGRGTLNLAAGVIDLLETFFPDSFDTLPVDKGIMEGPKPLLLQGCSTKDLKSLLSKGHEKIEFGANQVVIVANSEVKQDAQDEFPGSLVCTIYESKGLEFDDVLLYNIFKDSQANKEWRVVLNWGKEEDKAYRTGLQVKSERSLPVDDNDQCNTGAHARPLDFNPEMHKVLNSELKNLYTAITRARENVWIFDEDTTKHAPMFKYFLKRRLVNEPQRDEQGQLSPINVFAKASTPEEWCGRGEYFYKREFWELASVSFENGGDQRRATMALAHHLANQASQDATTTREKQKIRQRFLESADLFLQSGNHVNDREALNIVAIGLCNSRDFYLAAQLFERLGEFSNAAKMYTEANEKTQASRCFSQVGNFKDAVNSLRSVDMFEAAADAAKQYIELETRCQQEGLDPTVVMTAPIHTPDNLLIAATTHYNKHGEEKKLVSCLKRLPFDTRVACLKNLGRVKEAVGLLKEEGMSQKAADLLKSVGEYEKAAKTSDEDQHPQFVAECLLFQSRKQRKGATVDIQETKNILIRCRDLFNRCGNNEGRAEAMMMLGELTDDESMLHDAVKFFGVTAPAGATEAALLLIGKKKILSLEEIRLILAVLEDFFSLVRALLLDRDHSVKEQQLLKACELFYGVKCSEENTAMFSPPEDPRILDVFHREFAGRSELTANMTIRRARTCVARDLLRNLYQLIERLTEMLQSIVTSSRVCSLYTAGMSCANGNACDYLHHPYVKDTLNSFLQAIVFLIKVQGIIDQGFEKIKYSKWERVQQAVAALRDHVEGKFRPCDDLYGIVFPTHCHQRILTENVTLAKEAFHKFQGDAVVMSCIRDYAKSLWESASHSDKRSNTDLLIKIINLLRLAKEPPVNFSSLLASAEEGFTKWTMKRKHPEKIPLRDGMICSKDGSNKPLFFSFMRRLEGFVQDIYEREEALSSLDNMKAFIGFPANRAKEPLIPSFANTCFFMELLVVICYSMYAKMNQHELLCLPASYISMVHLCDRLWDSGKGSIYSAIQRLPYRKDDILRKVNECIWLIVDIICRRKRFLHFNVIDDVFRPNAPDYAESGEMERVFILALVLICGCGGPVPKNAEVPLRNALYKINIKSYFPQRLSDAIKGVRAANGIRDVVFVLQALLKARDQEYLRHCCWKYPDRMTKGIYRGLNFEQVTPGIFIRGFWRKIVGESLPHDDDVEAEAEDNSVSTYGQNDGETSNGDVLTPHVNAGIVEIESSQADEEGNVSYSKDEDDIITEGDFEEREDEELVDDSAQDMDEPTLAEAMYERISQQQADERRQAAAYKIQRFWRAHHKVRSTETEPELTHRTTNIERQMSVEQHDLREFKLDDTGCRICGVIFESRPYVRDDTEEQGEDQERDPFEESWDADPDGMKAEEEGVEARDIITREKHSEDPIHLTNITYFEDFKTFYITDVARARENFSKFMREARMDREDTVMMEIQKVHIAYDSFRNLLEKIKDDCAWNKQGDASRALSEFENALDVFHKANDLLVLDRNSIEGASAPAVDLIPVTVTQQQAKGKVGKGGRQRKKRKGRKSNEDSW